MAHRVDSSLFVAGKRTWPAHICLTPKQASTISRTSVNICRTFPVKVVALVGREQGLIVKRGNPKGIKSLRDLGRPDVQLVNRQRGAGTRVLLDYHLNLIGMPPDSILGYPQEEYTHLGISAAVVSSRADCGLGIAAAAQALDLDFVPLFQERYDLVIPKLFADGDLLAPLLDFWLIRPFEKPFQR